MIAEYKKKANIGIGLAILVTVVLIVLTALVSGISEETDSILKDIFVLPVFPFIYGLCCYAKGKGYHGAWGLLGVFTLIGLIILGCFPDRHKSIKESQKIKRRL